MRPIKNTNTAISCGATAMNNNLRKVVLSSMQCRVCGRAESGRPPLVKRCQRQDVVYGPQWLLRECGIHGMFQNILLP